MTGQFVGYHVEADHSDSVTIATGETREDCMRKTITRALVNPAFHSGSIDVQERNELAPEDFKALGEMLDEVFKEAHAI